MQAYKAPLAHPSPIKVARKGAAAKEALLKFVTMGNFGKAKALDDVNAAICKLRLQLVAMEATLAEVGARPCLLCHMHDAATAAAAAVAMTDIRRTARQTGSNHTDRRIGRQTDRQTGRQTDRQQSDGQTDSNEKDG